MSEEPMDVDGVLEGLNRALRLQYRSALQFTLASGSLTGLHSQGIALPLQKFGEADLADARRLVEKISALGGDATDAVADMRFDGNAERAVDFLIEIETEAIDALKDVIPATGDEGRSEALEHLLEHIIMRKQNQVDFLLRARRAD